MGYPAEPLPDLDYPRDYRAAEFRLRAQAVRDRIEAGTLPSWLSFMGPDGLTVRLVIDGRPTGPALAWPHALFIAAWLLERDDSA